MNNPYRQTRIKNMTNKELTAAYASAVIDLYNTGDSMAASQACAEWVNTLEKLIHLRMGEVTEDRS